MVKNTDFVFVDIETTGLSRNRHNIIEIAAARVKNSKIVEEYQAMINPETKIPRFITNLTGIDNSMVKDAPTVDKVLPDFLKFLGSSIFVAHNASFDYGFLNHNSEIFTNKTIDNQKLCTRKLANRLLPDLSSKKLGVICNHFEIENEQAHRALGDVRATVGIFNKFTQILKNNNITQIDELIEFENTPRSKLNLSL